jgi:hypothetical protein
VDFLEDPPTPAASGAASTTDGVSAPNGDPPADGSLAIGRLRPR